ncbi:nuclear transport factor 2 family protein [Marinivivus vitaminiproducens]|uniref:nuclear transport factor 2 family protein n=1 Tax=Marinivivus vitaminiproducens TaxID=3035935 RepID=UPI0027A47EAF|nr:nuclear transport factor 2 family protein [Geminicoccaceae bacterium SCSIO 64248]
MAVDLPKPLQAYFDAKNRHDIDGMMAVFGEDAIVADEGSTRRSHAEIRSWIEETKRKYADTAEVQSAEEQGGTTLVACLVSGTFPGSPAVIRHRFTLADGRIARIAIGSNP